MQSDTAHDALVEAIAKEIWDRGEFITIDDCRLVARAIAAIARPAIREECARVADDQAKVFKDEAHDQKIWGSPAMSKRALAIANYFEKHAAAIRAME
jgi:hypothetical protein